MSEDHFEMDISVFYPAQILLGEFWGKTVNFEYLGRTLSISCDTCTVYSLCPCHHERTVIFPMPRLQRDQRAQAFGMLQAGLTTRHVAAVFGVSHQTIAEIRRRHAELGTFQDRPRSGRPRVTTPAQDRHILLSHIRDRFLPASRTAAITVGTHGRPISHDTVGRRLRERQLRCRRPARGPILTPLNRQNRLAWARIHERWTFQRWGTVLFSDESRFCCSVADGRRRVWRRRNERFAQCNILEFDRWGGPNVMVWGAVSVHHRSELVVIQGNLTAAQYIEQVLQPHVIPFFEAHPEVRVYQQDNARPHAARLTRHFLQDQDIPVMRWMPYSPDFNPIEHLWDAIGRRVARRNPQTRPQLIRFLEQEWQAFPQEDIRRLILSMRRRCTECIDARGGHTSY